jgi:hypothetical protein
LGRRLDGHDDGRGLLDAVDGHQDFVLFFWHKVVASLCESGGKPPHSKLVTGQIALRIEIIGVQHDLRLAWEFIDGLVDLLDHLASLNEVVAFAGIELQA